MIKLLQNRGATAMGRAQNIHFVGIGGAGMCGIAEVLHNLGYRISGSDLCESESTRHLRSLGICVTLGHAGEQVGGSDIVVYSSAVTADNLELVAARSRGIPIVPRAEMLGELMRFRYGIAVAGSHGKTTTTSLIASLMADADLDPTYVIGGLLNRTGSSAQLGSGPYLVAEADESDRSFLLLTPRMAVLTNIDADHLEAYGGDLGQLRQAFLDFVHRLPFHGLVVWCADDQALRELAPGLSRPAISYGIGAAADYRGRLLECTAGHSRFALRLPGALEEQELELNMPGMHNLHNALGAVALVHQLGVPLATIQRGLARFQGVSRRCQLYGQLLTGRRQLLLIDDYAHHPRELCATLEAVRNSWPGERVAAVFQPHRYTRTRDLFTEFVDALMRFDALALLDVYPAGEVPLPGADSHALYQALQTRSPQLPLWHLPHYREVPALLPELTADCGLLLVLGAGNISRLAALLQQDCGMLEASA